MYSLRIESPESRPYDFKGADILAISSSGEMAISPGTQVDSGGLLARAPLAGGAAREVLAGVQYAGADWTPDGKELAVIHNVGPREDRLEYPIGKMLVESADNPSSPRFSPRGDAIAFLSIQTRRQPISVAIVEVSRHASKEDSLEGVATRFAGSPCWRPDGKEIWITAADAIHAEALYAIDLKAKAPADHAGAGKPGARRYLPRRPRARLPPHDPRNRQRRRARAGNGAEPLLARRI